jgi:uncharacterized protein
MHTQNSNALCACGSGNKYKHCCGHKSLTNNKPKQLTKQLTTFHQWLIAAVTNDFSEDLDDYVETNHLDISTSSYLNVFKTGLFFWFASYFALPKQKLTIYDLLLRFRKKDVSHEALRYLRHWSRLVPGMYHVDKVEGDTVTLVELTTDVAITIKPYRMTDFTRDEFVIGVLAPFGEDRQFLMALVQLKNTTKDYLLKTYDQFSYKQNMALYPNFLKAILSEEEEAFVWENAQQEEVADIFIDHMEKQQFSDSFIINSINFWHRFCQQNAPQFKNGAAYAAAVEYIMLKEENDAVTQSDIAERYEVNPSTLSQIIKKFG